MLGFSRHAPRHHGYQRRQKISLPISFFNLYFRILSIHVSWSLVNNYNCRLTDFKLTKCFLLKPTDHLGNYLKILNLLEE